MATRKTQYPELGYRMDSVANWRIVDTETDASIGPCYASKAELLADLYRFAKEFGVIPPPDCVITPDGFCKTCKTVHLRERAERMFPDDDAELEGVSVGDYDALCAQRDRLAAALAFALGMLGPEAETSSGILRDGRAVLIEMDGAK